MMSIQKSQLFIKFGNIFCKQQNFAVKSLSAIQTINFHKNISQLKDQRYVATSAYGGYKDDRTMTEKVKSKFQQIFFRHKIKRGSYLLYETIDELDIRSFMEELSMPDTFNSWFMIMELHVWMLIVKAMSDPENGKIVRNLLVEAMWKDVSTRASHLGVEHVQAARRQLKDLSECFQAALISYDEGLLTDDKVLAGALWMRLFNRNPAEPEHLEALVKYIRKTVSSLDAISMEDFVAKREVKWIALNEILKISK